MSNLPFKIEKFFSVGKNCIINDYNLIEKTKIYVKNNNISDNIFLISASTLSNFLIHELYKSFPNNTYIDIGSSLNPIFKLEGWKESRRYLQEYWLNEKPKMALSKKCYW